jgi:hypothetical protein
MKQHGGGEGAALDGRWNSPRSGTLAFSAIVSPLAVASLSCSGVGGPVALRKRTGSAAAEAIRTGARRRASHALMAPRLDQLAAKQ